MPRVHNFIPQKHVYIISPYYIIITIKQKSIFFKSFNSRIERNLSYIILYTFFIYSIGYIVCYLYIFFCSYFISRQSYIKQKTPKLYISLGVSFMNYLRVCILFLLQIAKLLLTVFLIVFLLLEESLYFLLVGIVVRL